jgi:hypothetical protein
MEMLARRVLPADPGLGELVVDDHHQVTLTY